MEFIFNKHFTPDEAMRALLLIKPIVDDILNLSHETHALSLMLGEDGPGHPQLQEMLDQLHAYLAELEAMGCYYKDWGFRIGLVDFPAIIGGKEVFLCWRSDEEKILYYHDIEAGYAGRKPIPDEHYPWESNDSK